MGSRNTGKRAADSRVRKRAKRFVKPVLISVLALAAVGGIWAGADDFLFTHTSEGVCWRVDPLRCHSLSLGYIERVTGLTLPPGSAVASSGTSSWLSWTLGATIRIPAGERLPDTPFVRDYVKIEGNPADGSTTASIYYDRDPADDLLPR
jgi:hypothetical protein